MKLNYHNSSGSLSAHVLKSAPEIFKERVRAYLASVTNIESLPNGAVVISSRLNIEKIDFESFKLIGNYEHILHSELTDKHETIYKSFRDLAKVLGAKAFAVVAENAIIFPKFEYVNGTMCLVGLMADGLKEIEVEITDNLKITMHLL